MTIIQTNQTLDLIGFFGPLIILITNIYNLWTQTLYLIGYFVFLLINSAVNKSLKSIFKEPRPYDEINIMSGEIHYGADVYGMPSGHAQSVSFSLIYLYLVQKSNLLLILNTIILLLTVIQRWNYRKHTIEQLLIGTMAGIICGISSYYIVKYGIENNKGI
jgi:membrane-associated phospholipid phosphatase